MVAPALGQAILRIWGWRSIFASFILVALLTLAWFSLRMPETLGPEHRAPFSLRRIAPDDLVRFRSDSSPIPAQIIGSVEQDRLRGDVHVIANDTPPHLASVSPDTGDTSNGTQVTLTGSDFQAGAAVYFGTQLGRVTQTKDSQTITALAPPQNAGVVDVSVINPDDRGDKLTQAFTYPAAVASGSTPSGSGGGGGGSLGLLTLGVLLICVKRK